MTLPAEPIELKVWMISLKDSDYGDLGGKSEASVIWAGNKLPKYLWDHWKIQLKPFGLTWQKFMQVLHYRTDIGIMWYKGMLPWNDFITSVTKLITGPIGKMDKGDQPKPLHAPSDIARYQIPPMRDWEHFERLCNDLWTEIWEDRNTQRNGRSGQRQNGVDIFGIIQKSNKTAGIQCKKKDATTASNSLTKKELLKIVAEAEAFQPALSELIIAYTGKRDVKLQNEARIITNSNSTSTKNLFKVYVYSWDDILEKLGTYGEVLRKHYPQFYGNNVDGQELAKKLGGVIEDKLGDLPNLMADASAPVLEKIRLDFKDSIIAGEQNEAMDHARDLLNSFKPKEALDYLEKIEPKILVSANKILKFRLLTNKGVAIGALGGREEEAGKLLIQAFQYNPEDEKALCNRALGHLLLGQFSEAEEFAEKVITKNPMSSRPYGILIQCFQPSEPLEKLIQNIPPSLRKTADIAHAISQAAVKRKDYETATHWSEVALQDSIANGEDNPELRASLASNILQTVSKFEVLNDIQLTPEVKSKITRAIDLLNEAIKLASNSESIKYRTEWLSNRGFAYKLLGKIDMATKDMDAVVSLQPDNPISLKHQALMRFANGDHVVAIETLQKLIGRQETPEAALLLANILSEKDQNDEAIKIIEESLLRDNPSDLQMEERRLLIQISLKKKNYDRAREISSVLRATSPTNILNLAIAARIERLSGNIDAASKLLEEARGYVTEKSTSHDIIGLAEELYDIEAFPDAWPLYERVVDVRSDSSLLNRLLYSYYRTGEVSKALELCVGIAPELKTPSQVQIELSILLDINNLKEAASLAEQYLKFHPEKQQIRVILANILFRMDEFDKLDAFLNEDIDISKLTVDAGFQLANLYVQRKMMEKSINTAYEVRRANMGIGEAHLRYVSIFFSGEQGLEEILRPPNEIQAGVVICIKNEGDEQTVYLLENRKDLNPAIEISVDSPLGKKLLGKKLNEEVVLSQGMIGETKVKITEIKNKYVYALHESLKLLPERFGETKGLERVPFKIGTEEETRESIQKMLDVVSKRNEWVMQAEKFYQDSKLTVGAFAQMIRINVIDVWNGLIGSKWGVRTCLGSPKERQKAISTIATHDVVAIDITALLTADKLDFFPILEKSFKKIIVAQSTLDLLLEAISERGSIKSKGYSTIGKREGEFFMAEITPENIKEQIERLEHIKKWIKKHCEVVPCKTISKVVQRNELEEMLGSSFLETILIAQENSLPLYTDDLGTRALASSNEFKVEGIWTQAIAMCALSDKQMTEDEYNKIVIQLIRLGYRHTTINGAVLINAAKEAKWSNTQPFTDVLNTLRGSQMEINSSISVIVDFMFLLWQQPIFDFGRNSLAMAALDTLSDQRESQLIIRLMRTAIHIRFRLLPLAEIRIQQVISAWEALRIKPTTI